MNPEDAFDIDKLLWNNSPHPHLLDLSPRQVYTLLYDPFSPDCVLQMATQIDSDVLDAMPLFRMAEAFLLILQREEVIKLTPKGTLPKPLIVELHATGFLPEELIECGLYKVSGESSCLAIQVARFVSTLAGFVRKEKGKLYLTKAARQCLADGNRMQFFKRFFQAFTERYSWGYQDGYPEEPVAQLGCLFSMFALLVHGSVPLPANFYADMYLRAFPNMLVFFDDEDINSPLDSFYACYETRFFKRFLLLFGFVQHKTESADSWLEPRQYFYSPVFTSVFSIDRT